MNKRLSFKALFFCNFLLFELTSSNKLWIEYPGFSSSESWLSGYIPCSQDEIIFPESYSSAILLPTSVDITGITLPNDGALILKPDSEIVFSSGKDEGLKCENLNSMAELKPTPNRHWFDPHNWRSDSDTGEPSIDNPAIPHIERIPCNNELVKIPATGALSIDLSDVPILRVGQINLDGSDVSKEFMEELFKSKLGEIIFKYASGTQVEYYKDSMCGCHKADVFPDYEWNVCQHVQDICERPKCLTPIIPSGHCCAICGVMIKVIVDECNPSYLTKLTNMVKQSLKEQEMEDKLSFHVSFVDGIISTYLQVIVVEKDDYEEQSINFMHRFNQTTSWDVFKGNKKEFFTSGRSYNPNGLGTALLFVMGALLGVLAFFVVIFAHFVPDNGFIRLPRWTIIRWNNIFQSPFVFARFDNTATVDGETGDNLVIDVQQYNESEEHSEPARGTSTSFDNPMFVEKQSTKCVSQDGENEDIPLREEDLTEIDLETETEGRL